MRQRLLNAIKRQNGSAFGTGTSVACVELMERCGAAFPEAHTTPDKMAELAATGHTVLGFDIVMPLFSVCHEAAAMGCAVKWGSPTAMPESGKPIFRTADDIRIPPDLLQRPGCSVPLAAIAVLKRRLGDSAAVCGKVMGPWTQAYHYYGVENFLIGTLDDPDATRTILDRLVPVTLAFARAQVEAGADCILLADHATRDLCRPTAYGTFLQALHSHLAADIPVPTILHICGNTADRIGMIAQTGLAGFHWDTKTGPAADVRRLAGDRLALMGGVSNFTLLRGSADDVRDQVQAALEAGIDIVGPECAIPLTTPLANLLAIAADRV